MGALSPFLLVLSQLLGSQQAAGSLANLLGVFADRLSRPGALGALEGLAELIPPGKEGEAAEALKQVLEGLTKWKAVTTPMVEKRTEETRTVLGMLGR